MIPFAHTDPPSPTLNFPKMVRCITRRLIIGGADDKPFALTALTLQTARFLLRGLAGPSKTGLKFQGPTDIVQGHIGMYVFAIERAPQAFFPYLGSSKDF